MNTRAFKCVSNHVYCIWAQAVYANLIVAHRNLTQEEENGGGQDGVDADEEVDAHVADEGHLCIPEDAWQQIHPGEGSEPEELTMTGDVKVKITPLRCDLAPNTGNSQRAAHKVEMEHLYSHHHLPKWHDLAFFFFLFFFFTEVVQAFNRLNRAVASLMKVGTKEILNSGEGKIP